MTEFDPLTASEDELRAKMDEWMANIPESLPDSPSMFYNVDGRLDRLAEVDNGGDSSDGE